MKKVSFNLKFNRFTFNIIKCEDGLRLNFFSTAVALLIFINLSFFSQVTYDPNQNWQWLHPKPQGNVLKWCKMWDVNNWYMAGDYGTFIKTTNGGNNWIINYNAGNTISGGQKTDVWDVHFFDQNTGITVGGISSARRTTDGGVTFDSIPGLDIILNTWFNILFLDNNTGYIAGGTLFGTQGKLAKTTNGGNNWSFINSISPALGNYDVYTPDNSLILLSSSAGNIQRSTDGGSNWTTINTGASFALYKICFMNRDTGFTCGRSGTINLTTNGGLNWTSINNGLPQSDFYDMDYKVIGQNKVLYLTGNPSYIYKTSNLGTTWDTVGFWGFNQSYMGIFQRYQSTDLLNNDTLLTVGSYSLINKRESSTNKILYSEFAKFGPAAVYDVWVAGSKIWGVGSPTIGVTRNDQIIYSSNYGATWIVQNSGNPTASLRSICMTNNNMGYIVGSGGYISKTINGGTNWVSLISPTANDLQRIEFVNENTGWVFGNSGSIYKTIDGGVNWIQQTTTEPSGIFECSSMLNENSGWIVGESSESLVFKTSNGGANWVQQNPNLNPSGANIFSIKMLNENTGYLGGYEHLRKTTNGGNNWDPLALPLPPNSSYQITGIDFINPDVGMVLSYFITMKTTNGGISWIVENTGTQTGVYTSGGHSKLKLVSPDSAISGGYYAGVQKYVLVPIGIIEWQTGVPKTYTLYQNYPNPFNPSTTIKFELPKTGNVTLKVYDITGREVRTVIDNLGLNPGTITHQFDGTDLSSGIYFYSLYADGNLIDSKKMILVK